MPDSAYATIKNKILTILQTVTKIQEFYGYPILNFGGYPAAVIVPSSQDADYETNVDNQRIYAFQISIFQEIQEGGIENALDALYDLADDVLNAFDKNPTLTGISLPTGYTMIYVVPSIAAWHQIEDKDVLSLDITLKVRVSIDITSV
jgi:hypothetical protein